MNKNYENMKSPLAYQITEYDCGQSTLLNAMRFLFKRGEIPPIIIKYITQYTLDTLGENGQIGLCGTSPYAIEYLCNWINSSNDFIKINLRAKILIGSDIDINNKELNDCLKRGGVAVFRVWSDCEHYVLCTKIKENNVYVFDPYFLNSDEYDNDSECVMVFDKPFEYNRIVSKKRFNSSGKEDFSFVKNNESRILLLYRQEKAES